MENTVLHRLATLIMSMPPLMKLRDLRSRRRFESGNFGHMSDGENMQPKVMIIRKALTAMMNVHIRFIPQITLSCFG